MSLSQRVLFASQLTIERGRRLPISVNCDRASRVTLLAMVMLAFFSISGSSAIGQDSTGAASTLSAGQPSGDESNNGATPSNDRLSTTSGRDDLMDPSASATSATLSYTAIVNILQQDPDLVVELKSMVADRMLEQGSQIDANSISDEMLYGQIAASASLRAGITTFLRARGYVSADDLQTFATAAGNRTGSNDFSSIQDSPLLPGSAGSLASGVGLSDGPQRVDENGLSAIRTQSTIRTRGGQIHEETRKRNEEGNASTDEPKVLRQPTPYNLQSMRDLYTQIPDQSAHLKRFGSEVFLNREDYADTGAISGRDTSLDVPLGPDYVVGPGDSLTINLWGSVTQSISRTIDRDGHILLPEAGLLQVAGQPLEQAEKLIDGALKRQYRNAQIAVTVSRLRSVRVYVVGDVQRPGGYEISSLATPLSALYAAGGPTSVGSLRTLRHYREKQLIEEVDLYDFLLHGIRNGSARFEAGDTLLVPPAGPQVAAFGAIKRPAIYELKTGESTLAAIIEDAGGFTAAASLGHIRIERIDANRQRETVALSISTVPGLGADRDAIAAFQVRDGDRIHVDPVLPYSQRTIYLQGHVVRPGRLPYTDGMRLSDVLQSYQDLLPEPAAHGEIVRLSPPDLHAETIEFNLPDVLIGNANVDLQPYDTIRILGRYQADAPKVTVSGEVLRPGPYPMSRGMTAAQLVRMAGGFKRDALLDSADLSSYNVSNGDKITESLAKVRIGDAVSGADASADVPLKPGDILSIHQVTGWNDIGQSVRIEGQVRFPGGYGFVEGERVSAVLRRAGGLLPTAYTMGAVLVREQVRDLEERSREELIRQIETNSAAARLSPSVGGAEASTTLQLIKAQQEQVIADLKSHPPAGRMVIHITPDIDSWANTPADIELRRGDVLTIPKRPGFVLVTGQVYNATALTYLPGKTAGWYLGRAGGTNATANRKEVFIIRANGTVVGRHSSGVFDQAVLSTTLNPGDVVVVPQKVIGSSVFWKTLLTTGQFAASIALTAGVAAAAL
jgi:protein involved in polysaccharide export with SLBB domain